MTSKTTRSCVEEFQVSEPVVSGVFDLPHQHCSASHKIYGIPQTINSANYVYFLAYQQLFALRNDVQSQTNQAEQPRRLFKDTDLDRIVTGQFARCYTLR